MAGREGPPDRDERASGSGVRAEDAGVSADALLAELAERELERLLAEEREADAVAAADVGEGDSTALVADTAAAVGQVDGTRSESSPGSASSGVSNLPSAPTPEKGPLTHASNAEDVQTSPVVDRAVAAELATEQLGAEARAGLSQAGPDPFETAESQPVPSARQGETADAVVPAERVAPSDAVAPTEDTVPAEADGNEHATVEAGLTVAVPQEKPAVSAQASPPDAAADDPTQQLLDALFEELQKEQDASPSATSPSSSAAGNSVVRLEPSEASDASRTVSTGRTVSKDATASTAGAVADSGVSSELESELDQLFAELNKPLAASPGQAAGAAAATRPNEPGADTAGAAGGKAHERETRAVGETAIGPDAVRPQPVSAEGVRSATEAGTTPMPATPLVLRSAADGEAPAAPGPFGGDASGCPVGPGASTGSVGASYRGPPFVDAPDHWEPSASVLDALPDVGESRWVWLVRVLELLDSPFASMSTETRDLVGKVAIVTLMNAIAVLAYVYLVRGGPY